MGRRNEAASETLSINTSEFNNQYLSEISQDSETFFTVPGSLDESVDQDQDPGPGQPIGEQVRTQQ
jgi:hypothetical protein